MEAVARRAPAPFLAMGGGLEVIGVPQGRDNLAWVLRCVATDAVGVVDGVDAEAVLALCAARGWRLSAVFNTHRHGDHVGINLDLQRRGALEGARVLGYGAIPGLTEPVDEGDEVTLGAVTGRVLRTEGHLDGHLSFVFGDALFCGDTLFAGGCGYLFDGPPAAMWASLRRLAGLPGGTRVCCAHEYTEDNLAFARLVEPGNAALAARIARVREVRASGGCTLPSTMDEERATNPFLRTGSPELRAALAAAVGPWGAGAPTHLDVFTALRAWKDAAPHRAIGAEGR
jgi:hydroxyacylglutathione hydrolase